MEKDKDTNVVSVEQAAAMVSGKAPIVAKPEEIEEAPPVSQFAIFADIANSDVVAALEDSAFTSLAEVEAAMDDDLKAVKGIGPATVRKMRDVMGEGMEKVAEAEEAKETPGRVSVGPKAKDMGAVKLRATGNYSKRHGDQFIGVVRGQVINEGPNKLPREMCDEMVARGEAALLPG